MLAPGVLTEILGRPVTKIVDRPATPPGQVVDTCLIYGGQATGVVGFPYRYQAVVHFSPGGDPGTQALDQAVRKSGNPVKGTANVYVLYPGTAYSDSAFVAIGPNGDTVTIGVGYDTTSQTTAGALVGNPNIAIMALTVYAG